MEKTDETPTPYRVLARKYRPSNFGELVGQDALVRTLTRAIETGRVAHAFMLTGVRGVGKTTTARIIAKALNYTGADGTAGPTAGPTDDCPTCQAIAADRHPDVMEMDAASRTGVDDIREILDGVRYAPTSARFKIYIIDEVHMLSKQAFNALLKTLEEPPEHVKFIFATTEIRKVPVTVLSRCQRFDLRRVDVDALTAHFRDICAKENAPVEDEALALIARAADGSVRDGLSLLDQAIAHGGGATVSGDQVRNMLGLADRSRSMDLFEKAVQGHCAEALEILDDLHRAGADPLVLVQDLLEIAHILSRSRVAPDADPGMDPSLKDRVRDLSGKFPIPALGRAWQILLKGLGDLGMAPDPRSAASMLVIRLSYAAALPDPASLLRQLQSGETPSPSRGTTGGMPVSHGSAALALDPQESVPQASPRSLEDVVSLLETGGEPHMAGLVYHYVRPVRLKRGTLEISLLPDSPPKLSQDLGRMLSALTGERWMVSVSSSGGEDTLAQKEKRAQEHRREAVLNDPLVRTAFALFPDAQLKRIYREDDTQ